MEHVLFGTEVNQEEAYFLGPPDDPTTIPVETPWTDPEHGGEYTTYPLLALVPQRPGDPRYIEFAAQTARNLSWTGACSGDECWTGIPRMAIQSDRLSPLQPRALSACRRGEHDINGGNMKHQDVLRTMKVLAAGFQLLDHNGHARLDLWKEYGWAWKSAALSARMTTASSRRRWTRGGNTEGKRTGGRYRPDAARSLLTLLMGI